MDSAFVSFRTRCLHLESWTLNVPLVWQCCLLFSPEEYRKIAFFLALGVWTLFLRAPKTYGSHLFGACVA